MKILKTIRISIIILLCLVGFLSLEPVLVPTKQMHIVFYGYMFPSYALWILAYIALVGILVWILIKIHVQVSVATLVHKQIKQGKKDAKK